MRILALIASVLVAQGRHDQDRLGSLNVFPTPQYLEPLKGETLLSGKVRIVAAAAPPPKVALASKILKDEFETRDPRLKGRVEIAETGNDGAISIELFLWPDDASTRKEFNLLDRQVLSHPSGQGYVLRPLGESAWMIAGRPQGILYGAMTLLQLVRQGASGLHLPRVYIRDFPHLEIRAAADFLLNGEVNRWSLDRGQGWAAYEALCKRKIDQCLRYKINAIVFDGFGWGLDSRAPEYAATMQRLNAHARDRGIRLSYGGYGAGYGMVFQKGPLYEGAAYLGKVHYNRESYPDGPTYSCMKEPRSRAARAAVDTSVLGTCRGNDELNRLKAAELRDFVRAVEPGMLYIHHEDFGDFDTTQASWKFRCDRCRKRWPNEDGGAPDGAAGALAHGYSWLINAVNDVKKPETGYDASRDCVIILTSPVYLPGTSSSEAWSDCLRFWQSVAKGIPRGANVVACFRETFPQEFGTGRWTEAFNRAMEEAGAELRPLLFSIVGGDHWLNDYPVVAGPVYNSAFLGARGILHDNGDAFQEPQQLLNAEYAWNAQSRGFYKDPRTGAEGKELFRKFASNDLAPDEIFGESGFLRRACESLYGERSAGPMWKFYREFRTLSYSPGETKVLPMAWEKIYATPAQWRSLVLDRHTWDDEIKNEAYLDAMKRLKVDRPELHRRLRKLWETKREMLSKGADLLKQALETSPVGPSREDLEFLAKCTETGALLAGALIHFHQFLERKLTRGPDPKEEREILLPAQELAEEAWRSAERHFPVPIDPAGGEVGTLKTQLNALRLAIRKEIKSRSEK